MDKSLPLLFIFPLLLTACDFPTAEERRSALHLAAKGFQGDVQQGQVLFKQNCAVCHGVGAAGTKQGPPLVHDVYRSGHHADLAFHFAVRDGVRSHHWNFGDMKPLPGITPEQVEHIIAYVRDEQRRVGIQ